MKCNLSVLEAAFLGAGDVATQAHSAWKRVKAFLLWDLGPCDCFLIAVAPGQVLGVGKKADTKEIKRAYKRLVRPKPFSRRHMVAYLNSRTSHARYFCTRRWVGGVSWQR
jgi:hypothetical protein